MDFLFKLRGSLTNTQQWILGILGLLVLVGFWEMMAYAKADRVPVYDSVMPTDLTKIDKDAVNLDSLQKVDDELREKATEFKLVHNIVPPVGSVIKAFQNIFKKDNIGENSRRSVWLNLQGYFWAIVICIPVGLLIGLIPLFRGMFSKQIDATRFLPLTALTGLFMTWFGTGDGMKVAFLAFGIIVYLLPVVVQRVDEVADVHLKTAFTLGANWWQTIRTVYLPSILSKLSDDIRVLTAISWTYIIVAELVNDEGGLGALINRKGRTGDLDSVFAILFIIIFIGIIQDRIFLYLDKVFFPHKYYKVNSGAIKRGVETMRYGTISFVIGLAMMLGLSGDLQLAGWGLLAIGIGFIIYGEIIVNSKKESNE